MSMFINPVNAEAHKHKHKYRAPKPEDRLAYITLTVLTCEDEECGKKDAISLAVLDLERSQAFSDRIDDQNKIRS